jgi:hypothetical protein
MLAGHAGNVQQRAEPGPPLTPDERDQAAKQREQVADQRDAKADLRDADADERDRLADQRDAKADLRDADADERDRLADQRDREVLRESTAARLQARLETMPVIEQAKGIIMEQNGCTAEEAFDLLRKASQRGNVPVRDLAARIVGGYHPPKPSSRPHDSRSQRPAQ